MLVAPKTTPPIDSREIYKNGIGDYGGRYKDGAFYAEPDTNEEHEYEEKEEDYESRYFNAILARFQVLKSRLRQTTPLEALQKVDDDRPIYLGQYTMEKVRWWRWKLRTTDPVPAQVASMDKETVLGLLKLMAGGCIAEKRDQSRDGCE